MNVAVVGEGERFEAIVSLLQATGAEFGVLEHSQRSEKVRKELTRIDLEDVAGARIVFVAVATSELRDVARALGDVMSGRHCIVHACHNLEPGSLATASNILRQETPTHRIGFLTGPMASEELQKGLPASGVCATRFPELCALVDEYLVHPGFRVYRSSDIEGAELAAAYARVIAMAAGVGYAMNLGLSVQATLFARGLAEVGRFVASRGGSERTTFGIAGSANLHLDTVPPGSVDFRVGGFAHAEGKFDPIAIEKKFGTTARDLLHLVETLWYGVRDEKFDAHILEACHLMVSGEYEPPQAVAHLMTLPTLDD